MKAGHRVRRYPWILSGLLLFSGPDNLAEAFYEFEIGLKGCGNRLQGKTQHQFLLRALHLAKNRVYQDPRISRRPWTKTKQLV